MAVYKHTYKGYTGRITPPSWRWFIVARYSFARLFQSKLLGLFLCVCMFYPLFCISYMYLLHNPNLMTLLQLPVAQMLQIDGRFFYALCIIQGSWALLLTAFIGPGQIAPDMANGSLPLYFCKPFSRVEYIAGKLCVLLTLLSIVTWIPGLIVYIMQGLITGWDWESSHLYLAFSLFIGLAVWILVLALIALAVSAFVKWRVTASACILALFFAGAGFGTAINNVMRTPYGTLIDLSGAVRIIWADLLRYDAGAVLPAGDAWLVMGIVSAICCWLLARRIRPFEVIK